MAVSLEFGAFSLVRAPLHQRKRTKLRSGALEALIAFLTTSDAGAAYRALVGEAQHGTAVRDLLSGSDPIGESAAVVIARALPGEILRVPMPQATAQFVGPVFFWILSGRASDGLDTRRLASEFLNSATSA